MGFNKSKLVKELIEIHLFLGMFRIVKKDKGFLRNKRFEGTLWAYCIALGDICSNPTKYEFLKKLVCYGALKSSDSKWVFNGDFEKGIKYVIDNEKLYLLFQNSDFGKKIYEVFDDYNIII